jgi:hypothetical protein
MAKRTTTKKTTPSKTSATTKKGTTTRKKVVPKKSTTTKSTAKKTTTKKPTTRKKAPLKVKLNLPKELKEKEEIKTTRKKPIKNEKNISDNYIRVSENAKNEKFVEMGERVQRGELQWAYYAIDGNVGYHYYKKLNKEL